MANSIHTETLYGLPLSPVQSLLFAGVWIDVERLSLHYTHSGDPYYLTDGHNRRFAYRAISGVSPTHEASQP